MPELNLSGDKNEKPKSEKKKGYTKVTVAHEFAQSRGNFEDMQKAKENGIQKVYSKIEELFKNYDGGGVAIVINKYDENGHVTGNEVCIMGIDQASGLFKLAKGLQIASEDIIETLVKEGGPEIGMEILTDMLHSMGEDN